MKTKFLFFGMLLSLNLTFSQANTNQSLGSPAGAITQPIAPFATEIFRFRSGFVSQIDSGTGFGFTADRWFSLGRVSIPGANQNFYGLRFQQPNRGFVMGYNTLTATNPVIQWIGTGANLGNLEFRVANTFGSLGAPGADVLVATMTKDGNTVFGNTLNAPTNSKVTIANNLKTGLTINSTAQGLPVSNGLEINQTLSNVENYGGKINISGATNRNVGLDISSNGGNTAIGLNGVALNSSSISIGVSGNSQGNSPFSAGIYGLIDLGTTNTSDQWAGYFDGNVYYSGAFTASDAKLKENMQPETSVLSKLLKLNPVTYNYKKLQEINLPTGLQHGFIAQELATVFPELTKDVKKPVFDKEQNVKSLFEYKTVNYNGLFAIMTTAIQELHSEIKLLKSELTSIRETKNDENSKINIKKAFMEQNIPNPFSDQTTIRYQLPENTTAAEIMVMDLNGTLIKSYTINKNQSEIIVKSFEIGKGLFIYSLVQNGQELVTKKMIVK